MPRNRPMYLPGAYCHFIQCRNSLSVHELCREIGILSPELELCREIGILSPELTYCPQN
jgi:hypothetical protein